jgi:hypothetical protein
MRFIHALVTTSWSVLVLGLAAAYVSAGAGLAGFVDVRRASLVAILATTVALCAMVAHFVAAMRELQTSGRAHEFK